MSDAYLVQHADRGMYEESWPVASRLSPAPMLNKTLMNSSSIGNSIPLTFNVMTPNGILLGDVFADDEEGN